MPKLRPKVTIRALLVLIALVAMALWGWPRWLRYRTARAVQSFGYLADDDTATHQRATEAILSIGGGRASVAPLIEALRSNDVGLQFTAAYALGGIGPDAIAAVPALIELLGHPDLYVRQTAPNALGAIGPAARGALPALVKALGDVKWLIRTNASQAILRIDPSNASVALPVLRQLCNDPDPQARAEARRIIDLIEASERPDA